MAGIFAGAGSNPGSAGRLAGIGERPLGDGTIRRTLLSRPSAADDESYRRREKRIGAGRAGNGATAGAGREVVDGRGDAARGNTVEGEKLGERQRTDGAGRGADRCRAWA